MKCVRVSLSSLSLYLLLCALPGGSYVRFMLVRVFIILFSKGGCAEFHSLLPSDLFHHDVQRVAVFHVQLLRRLVLSNSLPVEQESNGSRLERFALQERVEDLFCL
jgi:hypothetical protein